MQKTTATWVSTNNPLCNHLQRSYYTVDGLKQKKIDAIWVAQVSKKYNKFAIIVKTKFMETDGSHDNNFLKGSHGCERIWENLKPEIQYRALYNYDIVKQRHRSPDEMFNLAEMLWGAKTDKLKVKHERDKIEKFMETKRFMEMMVKESLSQYNKDLEKAFLGNISQDSVIEVGEISKDIIQDAHEGCSTGLGKRSRIDEHEKINLIEECDKDNKGDDTVIQKKKVEVKIEEFDGSYDCLICSKSVRSKGLVLACSRCSSNPFHESCVKNTRFMKICPQCGCETIILWKNQI